MRLDVQVWHYFIHMTVGREDTLHFRNEYIRNKGPYGTMFISGYIPLLQVTPEARLHVFFFSQHCLPMPIINFMVNATIFAIKKAHSFGPDTV